MTCPCLIGFHVAKFSKLGYTLNNPPTRKKIAVTSMTKKQSACNVLETERNRMAILAAMNQRKARVTP